MNVCSKRAHFRECRALSEATESAGEKCVSLVAEAARRICSRNKNEEELSRERVICANSCVGIFPLLTFFRHNGIEAMSTAYAGAISGTSDEMRNFIRSQHMRTAGQ